MSDEELEEIENDDDIVDRDEFTIASMTDEEVRTFAANAKRFMQNKKVIDGK